MSDDADRALAQIKAAMDAGPTPGPWQKATDWKRAAVMRSQEPYTRVVCTGNQNNDGRWSAEDWSGATWTDADYIAACNPSNMAAIVSHIDAQAAEIERLRADAERYRWLRAGNNFFCLMVSSRWNSPEQLDREIDEARKA